MTIPNDGSYALALDKEDIQMTKRSQPYRPRVFISYAARGTDAESAQALREALIRNKVRVPAWRDKEEIHLGRRAIQAIEVGIAECDFFLLLVSPRSVLGSCQAG